MIHLILFYNDNKIRFIINVMQFKYKFNFKIVGCPFFSEWFHVRVVIIYAKIV